jgi:hypothetical protein
MHEEHTDMHDRERHAPFLIVGHPSRAGPTLMPEVPHLREHHGDTVLIGRLDHVFILQ